MPSEWRFVCWDQDLDHLGVLAPVLTGLKLQVTLGLGRWFYDCDLGLACLISAFLSPTMPGSQGKGMIECGQIFGRRWLLLGCVWIMSHYFFMGKVIDTVDGGWLRRKRKREHQGKWKPFKEQWLPLNLDTKCTESSVSTCVKIFLGPFGAILSTLEAFRRVVLVEWTGPVWSPGGQHGLALMTLSIAPVPCHSLPPHPALSFLKVLLTTCISLLELL